MFTRMNAAGRALVFATVSSAATLIPFAPAHAETLLEVGPEGCAEQVAIGGALAQSFTPEGGLDLQSVSVWMTPGDGDSGHDMFLLQGAGPSSRPLGLSQTVTTAGGGAAGWQAFAFDGVALAAGESYTFVVVPRSPSGGTLAQCAESHDGGRAYRPGAEDLDPATDFAFRVEGTPSTAAADAEVTLPPPADPGEPANALPPETEALLAERDLAARKMVMPLGDSITDMPDNMGAAWGGYRKDMANDATFARVFQFIGSYGVYQYSNSPSPWDMPWDQRFHCGWSGATMDGYGGNPSTSIIQNYWKCRTVTASVDYVLMHAGTNDLRNTREPANVLGERVAMRTVQLMEGILQYSTSKIIVAQLIPQTGGSAQYNPNVIEYNKSLAQMVAQKQADPSTAWYWRSRVKMVDMYQAFFKWTGNQPQAALQDGLHPSLWGAQIMSYEWRAAIYTFPN
ncbi:GDSL-type esterase/lipase family protein [Stappia stellulata]|uniref:GDSL-type esterase/lipase family protein n=1 Tax=Stappia stellulata TaxID=71235 RepID=UPI001CD21DEE|nr:GDSL-type esterase/lipase family protein [Stappia stellulata]MCA1244604.1 GDSL-type esterase/lipase family protein [Stappia stellulata]